MNLTQALRAALPDQVDDSDRTRAAASRDASIFQVTPAVVVTPRTSRDVETLVQLVTKHSAEHWSLTARSGGTDMTGGPLTESIVVDFQKHMNSIGTPHNHTVTVQPGAWYRDLARTLRPHKLLLPSYPASKEICTVGGMVANNSGGEKTLTYGKTADYVRSLNVVLADGHEHTIAPLTRRELDEKLKQSDFEGSVYNQLFTLLEQHHDLLQRARPRVSKNSAGYALWDVWDKRTFDLTRLFTGSQGTLGLMTEITFKLVTPKPYSQMLVIFLRDLAPLADIVKTTLAYAPESFESYDDHTLALAVRFLPGLMRKMSTKGLASLLWSFTPELAMVVTGGPPKLVLLAEFTGHDHGEIENRAKAARAALERFHVRTYLTHTPTEVEKYWTIRRESFNLLRQHVRGKHTVPFIDDIIVRPETLPQFLPRLNEIMSHYKLTYTIAGHVGDGNFHIIPLMDTSRPDFTTIIETLAEQVNDLVLQFKGSLTAEHNEGLIRSHYVEKMFGPEVYNLFVETKRILDPHNIFNPGKKVGADWETAKKHLLR